MEGECRNIKQVIILNCFVGHAFFAQNYIALPVCLFDLANPLEYSFESILILHENSIWLLKEDDNISRLVVESEISFSGSKDIRRLNYKNYPTDNKKIAKSFGTGKEQNQYIHRLVPIINP